MESQDRLMKRREFAKIIGYSESYLEKRPQWIPVVQIGRSVRYRMSDADRIVKGELTA